MLIPGRLNRTTLGDVLGGLTRLEVSGQLELEELTPARWRHRIELREGAIVQVRSPYGPRLGALLKARTCSGSELPDDGPTGWSPSESTIAERWVARGYPESEVRAALAAQRQARLDYLFALRDARLVFRVQGSAPPRGLALEPLVAHDVLPGRRRFHQRLGSPRVDPRSERLLKTLGLPRGASAEEVRRAFRELARTFHPDRSASSSAEERRRATERFVEISSAYQRLMASGALE